MKEKIDPELGLIPRVGQKYWYIWSCMQIFKFKVNEASWFGGMTDLLRFAKGNVYLNRMEADNVETALNDRLHKLKKNVADSRIKAKLLEEEKAKLAEEKKRKAEEKKCEQKPKQAKPKRRKLTEKEKAEQYEKNKKRRIKKSPHPDIIV